MLPYKGKRDEPSAQSAPEEKQVTACANEDGTQFNTPKQLLDYCMKHGDTDPAEVPTDASRFERLNWLKDAWTNLSIDLIAKLKESLEILQSHADRTLTEDEQATVERAFGNIEMICEDMDFANDFFKVGAGPILATYLRSAYVSLRTASCNLLATLAQHNAFAQAEVIERFQLMPVLFEILVSDPDASVRLKALYAISALTRENKTGVAEFVKNDGFVKLASAIREQTLALTSAAEQNSATATAQKLILKSTFLLNNVVTSDSLATRSAPNYVALIMQLAATYRHFVTAATGSDGDGAIMLSVCESVANCLLSLTKRGGRPAMEALRDDSLQLEATLNERIVQLRAAHAADSEEPNREELEYANELRALISEVMPRRNDSLAACV